MIIRRLAKPLIAAIFIAAGIDAFRDRYARVKEVEPFVEKTVGKAGDTLSAQIPVDVTTLVTVDAAVKIGAGLALAFDKFPRLAAFALAAGLVPNSLATHAFWENDGSMSQGEQRSLFLRDLGLLGGLLMVMAQRRDKPAVKAKADKKASKKTRKRD